MITVSDATELNAVCTARGYNPVGLSGLAYILKVCGVKKITYKTGNSSYELTYRGKRAHGSDVDNKRRR